MINSGSAANATALPLMLVALRVLIKEHTRMQQALVCEFSDPRLPCSLVEATLQLISSHHLSGRSSLSSKRAPEEMLLAVLGTHSSLPKR